MAIALGILYSLVVVLHPLIVHLIPAVLLCISGLFTNLVQAICFVCIWPISENAYTRLNGVVKELDWRVLLGLVDWWAGVRILECIEQETSHLKGEECELVISNVRNDADPLLEQVLAQWSGLLGSSLAVIKASARYSPSALKDFPLPFWLSVVFERTGFTQGDLQAAQRLPVPSKVLSSDTTDLAYAVRCAYSAVPAIYVITMAISKTSPPPTLESVIKGGPSVVHVYIKRHATKKWLQTDDAVEKLCREILAAKDASLDEHITEHRFGDKGLQAIAQPPKCFLVAISSILLWALKLNFVCRSTLLVSSAAFFTGRMLALFGCGVLSMLRCLMGAVIANITWSDHLKPICEVLIVEFFETLNILPCDVDWW